MDYKKEIQRLFLDHPDGEDAKIFLNTWRIYIHAVDDVIDEDVSNEFIIKTFSLAQDLYITPFYLKYAHILFQTIKVIQHQYADSVAMERSSELWQREQADCLRSDGLIMLMTVVEILGGYDLRRAISIAARTDGYNEQHKDIIYETSKTS